MLLNYYEFLPKFKKSPVTLSRIKNDYKIHKTIDNIFAGFT